MKKINLTLFSFALLFSGCATTSMPDPQESEYIKTEGAGFILPEGKAALAYVSSYMIKVPFPQALYATVFFDNPKNRNNPFESQYRLAPKQTKLRVESKAFEAIKNGATYTVELRLYKDPDRLNLITTHVDQVKFNAPDVILIQRGIELL